MFGSYTIDKYSADQEIFMQWVNYYHKKSLSLNPDLVSISGTCSSVTCTPTYVHLQSGVPALSL